MSRLRERREQLGLTREALAAAAETSFQTIRRLETEGDDANTGVKLARRLARILRTSVERLFPGDAC